MYDSGLVEDQMTQKNCVGNNGWASCCQCTSRYHLHRDIGKDMGLVKCMKCTGSGGDEVWVWELIDLVSLHLMNSTFGVDVICLYVCVVSTL